MFLSIIIPVYNTEKYLAECLDSCLAQDIPADDYEIICVNDGSTDGSLDVLKSYQNRFLNIIVIDQKNAGVSTARNVGLGVAKGDYVWFIDSDDFIQANCLHYLKQIAVKSATDCVVFSSYFFDIQLTDEEIQKKIDKSLISNATFSCLWMRIFRRSLLSNLFFHRDITFGEDVIFIRQFYLLTQKDIHIDDILYFYRLNPTSLTHSTDKVLQRICSNTRGAIEMKKIYDSPNGACEANANILINFLNNALLYISRTDHPVSQNALKQLKSENLFPFKMPKECTTTKAYTTSRTDWIGRFYNWICVNVHTYVGYLLMKLWNFVHSITNRSAL